MDSAHVDDVADRYARFAEFEIRDRNPVFRAWSEGIAADPETAARIATLPSMQRQPVLVFAAARFAGCPDTTDYAEFRDFLATHFEQVAQVTATHHTQTNEARRIGCLLPFLAATSAARRGGDNPDGALSLIEVGASAGLCLYPDRYAYRFRMEGAPRPFELAASPSPLLDDDRQRKAPVLEIGLRGMVPAPRAVPPIAYRGGVDLYPVDPADPAARDWLRALVWPGHDERLARLDACCDIAAAEPADILAGDLVERVAESVARARAAAPHATPVVFHTAVLAYLEPERREEFAAQMRRLIEEEGVVWIASEGMTILPEVAAQVDPKLRRNKGLFLVSVDGTALATTHGHGEWVRSLD